MSMILKLLVMNGTLKVPGAEVPGLENGTTGAAGGKFLSEIEDKGLSFCVNCKKFIFPGCAEAPRVPP